MRAHVLFTFDIRALCKSDVQFQFPYTRTELFYSYSYSLYTGSSERTPYVDNFLVQLKLSCALTRQTPFSCETVAQHDNFHYCADSNPACGAVFFIIITFQLQTHKQLLHGYLYNYTCTGTFQLHSFETHKHFLCSYSNGINTNFDLPLVGIHGGLFVSSGET